MSKKEFEKILHRTKKESEESMAKIRNLNKKFNKEVRDILLML